jgi:hypothetical protein
MRSEEKCQKMSFSKILWSAVAILLCALPCYALDIIGEVTVPPNINDNVVV